MCGRQFLERRLQTYLSYQNQTLWQAQPPRLWPLLVEQLQPSREARKDPFVKLHDPHEPLAQAASLALGDESFHRARLASQQFHALSQSQTAYRQSSPRIARGFGQEFHQYQQRRLQTEYGIRTHKGFVMQQCVQGGGLRPWVWFFLLLNFLCT